MNNNNAEGGSGASSVAAIGGHHYIMSRNEKIKMLKSPETGIIAVSRYIIRKHSYTLLLISLLFITGAR